MATKDMKMVAEKPLGIGVTKEKLNLHQSKDTGKKLIITQ